MVLENVTVAVFFLLKIPSLARIFYTHFITGLWNSVTHLLALVCVDAAFVSLSFFPNVE